MLHQLQLGQRLSHSDQWPIYIFQPGRHPQQNLAEAFVDSNLSDIDQSAQLDEIEEYIHKGIEGLHALILKRAGEGRVVLVADQFEEVFTLCRNDAERQEFFEYFREVLKLTGNKLYVIIVMRADFFGKCAEQEYSGLARAIQENLITVIPMIKKELSQAITEPAKMVEQTVESN